MGQRRKQEVARESGADQQMRDQEVVRANRELSAYFKGRRTEREARAALKIIKAFVRDRERRDAKNRPPLPGAAVTKIAKAASNVKAATDGADRPRRKAQRKPKAATSKSEKSATESPSHTPRSGLAEPDERTSN